MSKPPPLSVAKSVDKLKVREGDSLIVLRADESVEVYASIPPGKNVKRPAITALGLYWCLLDDDWRGKLDFRAKKKIEDILNGRD